VGLGQRVLLLLLLIGLAVAGGLLLAPPQTGSLPGAEALGQPSPATFKADRDHEIEDVEATSRRRATAAAAERPVYDEDDGADDEAVARVHAAFALMRDEAAAARSQGSAAGDAAELLRRYASQHDGFVARLQVLVSDEDLAALAAARFAEPVERDLAALAAKGLSGLVVGDLALLPADRAAGFTVRTFRGGEPVGERVVIDRALVRDLATAREEVARAAAVRLASSPRPLRAAVLRLATSAMHPTLVHNQGETERRRAEAAARIKPIGIAVRRGERIVAAGERIEVRHLAIFDAMRVQLHSGDRSRARLGGALLVALLAVVLWRFAGPAPRRRLTVKDATLLALLVVVGLAETAAGLELGDLLLEQLPGLPREALGALLPLAAGAVVARQVLSAEAALLVAVATGLGAGLVTGPSLAITLQATVPALAAAGLGGPGLHRGGLLRSGAAAGLAGALLGLAGGLQAGKGLVETGTVAGLALAGGLLVVPLAAWLLLIPVEGLLGYVTEGRLRTLANLNHPALKELIVQAPGTYHHAILTGSLVEAAAQAIGADALLARVAAYYHDIGKIRNPLFFTENQRGRSEHERLAPAMSALVVKRHVTDGLELARRWRLPRAVADIIPQHHGTRLVGYFWALQQKQVGVGQAVGGADEAVFRYPGPRPRSREAALVMLADVCEATARSLEAPTPLVLRTMVDSRVSELVAEGQLDESELTLGDLAAAADSLTGGLVAMYRARAESAGPAEREPGVKLVARP
jgi:hypothetical protein